MLDIRLEEYRRLYSSDRLKVDRSFNRRVVWTKEDANRYFMSLTRDRAPSLHIVADIQECMIFSKDRGNHASEQYYSKLHKGKYKNLSLDGQNRGESILRLLNNEIAISGLFIDADGKEVEVINTFFKDLPRRLQDKFNDSRISIKVYNDVLKRELTTIFKNIQAGCPLNAQETRNATLSPIAPWVRNQREKNLDFLKRITVPDHIKRMADDENIAKMAMVLSRDKEWGLSRKDIDSWYERGEDYNTLEDPNCPYGAAEIKRIEDILEIFGAVINNQSTYIPSKTIPKKAWWAALYACEWVYDNNCVIHSNEDFFNKLKEIDDKLTTDSNLKYAQDRAKLVSAGMDPDEVSQQNFYFRWQNLPHQAPARRNRKVALTKEIVKNKKEMKIRQQASKNAA